MRIVNIMNFVRLCEPRIPDFDGVLFETTRQEIALVKKFGFPNTFLLQYDALLDPAYTALFKQELDDRMELGLWLEIVQPLVEAVGLPWRSSHGWPWDRHIVPGFSMAYTPAERERIIDEAMRAFQEIYGFYPRTVGSWLLDTHTVRYLAERYHIDAVCICRDQINTDAYTLVGGYFNGAYYPSRNNLFTPAQTKAGQIDVPVIRLLTPDPVHNYDSDTFLAPEHRSPENACFTLEPVWKSGYDRRVVSWFYDVFFRGEDLGFSYAQLGQENSFGYPKIIEPLRMQFELLQQEKDVIIEKMGDTGARFKATYAATPETAVYADRDWCEGDAIQSLYYDSKRYTANLFRYHDRIFLRLLYLFDETVPEDYLDRPCTTWDATYENLPLVDTVLWDPDNAEHCGMTFDRSGSPFTVERLPGGGLEARWGDKAVRFREDSMEVLGCGAEVRLGQPRAAIRVGDRQVDYTYRGASYALRTPCGRIAPTAEGYAIAPENGRILIQL